MTDINQVLLEGTLADDVQVRESAKGVSYAKFKVVTTTTRGAKSYHTCAAFHGYAKQLENGFAGARIRVEGRLQYGNYVNREGVKVYTTEVMVDVVSFPGRSAPAGDRKPAVVDEFEDDIKF